MPEQELSKQVLEVIPIAMVFMRGAVKKFQEGNLKFPHYRIIGYLRRRGTASNRELSEWQGVSVATMSRTIDSMIKWGLISRTVNSENRREVNLELTKKGKKVGEGINQRLAALLTERLAKIPTEQKIELGKGLKVLADLFGSSEKLPNKTTSNSKG